jgi:hypothetical protein
MALKRARGFLIGLHANDPDGSQKIPLTGIRRYNDPGQPVLAKRIFYTGLPGFLLFKIPLLCLHRDKSKNLHENITVCMRP